MRRYFYFVSLSAVTIFFLHFTSAWIDAQHPSKTQSESSLETIRISDVGKPDVLTVLREFRRTIGSITKIKYRQSLELNYTSQDYLKKFTWDTFLDFETADGSFPKFQFENSEIKFVYNGSENFYCDKREQTLELATKYSRDSFAIRYFVNSIHAFREALPAIIDDDSIEKSLKLIELSGNPVYEVTLKLHQENITHFGSVERLDLPLDILYRIRMDANTKLPIEIVRIDPAGDSMCTKFNNFDLDPDLPTERSWFHSDYFSTFTLKRDDKMPNLLTVGDQAPHWKLTRFASDSQLSQSDTKSDFVLMEFWICHCGSCIASVPQLNELNSQFDESTLTVVGLNLYDSDTTIKKFIANNGPGYPVVTQAKDIASNYGVSAFPTVFLVGKDGEIHYSGSLDLEKIRAAIVKNEK